MKSEQIEVTGIASLLCNRYPTEDAGANVSRKKKQVYIPQEQAEKALYKMKDGTPYIPSEHIFQSSIKSSVDFKFEGKKTYKNVVSTGILVEPEEIPIITDKPYEIDARPVIRGRGRVLGWRPKFNNWKLRFTIKIIDSNNISLSVLKEILENAGATKGIGDYRPRFGRFMVTEFKEL